MQEAQSLFQIFYKERVLRSARHNMYAVLVYGTLCKDII